MRDFRPGHTWLPGKIVKCSGPVSYRVKIGDVQVVRRHQDHTGKILTFPVAGKVQE